MQNLPIRIKRAKELCNRVNNYSDFGHWQGSGKEPNCKLEERRSRTTVLEIHWPTDESVRQWDEFLNKNKKHTGYLITGVSSLSLALGGTIFLGAKAASGFGSTMGLWGADYIHDISMNELLSKVELPWATRGGYLSININKQFRYAVQDWKNEYIVENHQERFDHHGKPDGYTRYHKQSYKIKSEEEAELFRVFVQGGNEVIVMNYGDRDSIKKYPYYVGK